MEQQIIELETRVAFQEQTLQELNDIVTQQQGQIESLQLEIRSMRDKLAALSPSPVDSADNDAPPPHY